MRPFAWISRLACLGLLAGAIACATKMQFVTEYPLELDTATATLANHLLQQLQESRGLRGYVARNVRVALEPFVDSKSGEIVATSQKIEEIILREAENNHKKLVIERMNPDILRDADYVLNGIIYWDTYRSRAGEEKYYRLSSSIVDLKNGLIVANSNVWVSNRELDYQPTAFYRDTPVYTKDSHVEGLIATAKGNVKESASKDYYDTLETGALLVEARSFYEDRDYKTAQELFNKAAEREDGQVTTTYAGLYATNYKLGQMDSAGEAFSNLLKESVDSQQNMNIKFLFSVDSTEFIKDDNQRQQYALWLKQIGRYFKASNRCFHIVGHSSHSGTAEYNVQLSLARARRILSLISESSPDVKQRCKAIGKGFAENVVGSGTDDAQDAIDRRVEFALMNCGDL